jgi:uncharacterized protein
MTTYVDTSTLLKLFIEEPGSTKAVAIWEAADAVVASQLIVVEAHAAIAAAARGRRLTRDQHDQAKTSLKVTVEDVFLAAVTEQIVDHACVLAEDHGLRGYDAVHLATALSISATVFTSADAKLCEAAARVGFHVANPIGD